MLQFSLIMKMYIKLFWKRKLMFCVVLFLKN